MTGTMKSFLLASAAALAVSAPAVAQTTTTTAAGVETIEAVVVTARKSSERLQDVPLEISVYNPDELESRGISGLKDISQLTPGFVFQTYSTSFDSSPTIRGLTQFDVTSSIANVSTVVNGVYVPRNYSVDLGVGDVGRLEIVKGPQSALYGGNAFAGVISYSLAKPTAAPHLDATVTGGSAGRFDGKVDASGSLLNNTLQLRGYYASAQYDGTWKNNYPVSTGTPLSLGGYSNKSYGGDLTYTPVKNLEVDVSYFHLARHENVKPNFNLTSTDTAQVFNCKPLICGTLQTNPDAYSSATSTRPSGLLAPFQPGFTSATDFFDAQFKYDFTENFSATYLFGHVRAFATEISASADNPVNGLAVPYAAFFGLAPFIPKPLTSDQKEGGINELNSHELRFNYNVGHLKTLLGLYYANDRDIYGFNIWQAADGAAIGGNPGHPLDMSAFPFPLLAHDLKTDTTAEFGRISYGFLNERLTVAAEVRHSSDKLNNTDTLAGVNLTKTFDNTTPRISVDYKLSSHSLLYGSAAEGVKNGGFNGLKDGAVTLLTSQQTFLPETNWTYEFGSKNTFMGGRLRVNADVFLVKWSNLQIQEQPLNTPATLSGSTSVITTNLGAATSYGLESDGFFAATKHLDLNYALALIDPTFDNGDISQRFHSICTGTICPANDAIGGKTLPRTSKVQLAGGATWKDTYLDKYKWNVHGEFTYQSEQQVEEMNVAQVPSRLLFNLSAGVKYDGWEAVVWGKNVFGEKYVADSFFIASGVGYGVSLGEKATFGATLSYHY